MSKWKSRVTQLLFVAGFCIFVFSLAHAYSYPCDGNIPRCDDCEVDRIPPQPCGNGGTVTGVSAGDGLDLLSLQCPGW